MGDRKTIEDLARVQIKAWRDQGKDWDFIKFTSKDRVEMFDNFIKSVNEQSTIEGLTKEIWLDCVSIAEDIYNNEVLFIDRDFAAQLDFGDANDVAIPQDQNSCWQQYRSKLSRKGFSDASIISIEESSYKILKRLSKSTESGEAIKGLVVGNVQSGKTANMAALMSMAADYGWNLFILLSGTIDNLRVQTRDRLSNDLICDMHTNLTFNMIENPYPGDKVNRLDLYFSSNKKNSRYFAVCLKNSTRLENLLKWLYSSTPNNQNINLFILDDEADQAGINTANISEGERTKINKLITDLVNGKDHRGRTVKEKFSSINYISYTATPYANVLNDSRKESLYPRSFIHALTNSREYFGPQQIFGSTENDKYPGLDVIRDIDDENYAEIELINKGQSSPVLPKSLEDALLWYYCSIAYLNKKGVIGNFSMLIHTSSRQIAQNNISKSLVQWHKNGNYQDKIERAKYLWTSEINRFNKVSFQNGFPDYPLLNKIEDPYNFDDIENQVEFYIKGALDNINLFEDQPVWSDGITLCVDHSGNSKIDLNGAHKRLMYPENPKRLYPFIVIGGNTLSRGLTLDGLMCSYFSRKSMQADTLMQMGRWFGYRRGYELLQRIWLTDDTLTKFEYLSELDLDLRKELRRFQDLGAKPSEFGPRLLSSPMASFLITSKRKSQSSIDCEFDFSGSSPQTTAFENNKNVMSSNISIARNFVDNLGSANKNDGSFLWKKVDSTKVIELLKHISFAKNNYFFANIENFNDWLQEANETGSYKEWNIALCGNIKDSTGEPWNLKNGSINKINRSRKMTSVQKDKIDIGVLRSPKDLLLDIDQSIMEHEDIEFSKNAGSGMSTYDVFRLRNKYGLGEVPLLNMFVVDKNSKAGNNKNRRDLCAEEDIIGISLYIPGSKTAGIVKRITVKIDNSEDVNDEGEEE